MCKVFNALSVPWVYLILSQDGFTPLSVGLQQGHDKVVACLLEHEAGGRLRLPALHIAAKKNDARSAALLLKNEPEVNKISKVREFEIKIYPYCL